MLKTQYEYSGEIHKTRAQATPSSVLAPRSRGRCGRSAHYDAIDESYNDHDMEHKIQVATSDRCVMTNIHDFIYTEWRDGYIAGGTKCKRYLVQ